MGTPLFESLYILEKLLTPNKEARARREYKRKLRESKKAQKWNMIKTYGPDYYFEDVRWKRIKDQNKDETEENWKRRLAIWGFSPDGVCFKTGNKHIPAAKVFSWSYYTGESKDETLAEENQTVKPIAMKGDNKMESNVYQTLVNSLKANPRNIQSKKRLWSYYHVESGIIIVSRGTKGGSNSKITKPRTLSPTEAEKIFEIWKSGATQTVAKDYTENASYWYALFENVFGGK
ncbi:MAG: hypothetical protein J5921_01700 [Clostridia bacterium]|nr:hypothetical protein [Clostridia bacterium]